MRPLSTPSSKPKEAWPLWVKRGLAPFFSVLLALVLLEAGVRILEPGKNSVYREDSELGWRFKPHAAVEISKGAEQLNSRGWRGPERDYSSKGKSLRIACLGDSCTFGVSLPEDKDTYPRRLENILRQDFNLAGSEVFNFGTNGYGTFHGAVLMRNIVPEIQPDIAVAYYGWNDRTRVIGWFDHEQRIEFIRSPWHHSAVLRVFFRLTEPWVQNLRYSRKLRAWAGDSLLKNPQTLEKTENNLRAFIRLSREKDIVPVLVTAPYGKKGGREYREQYEKASPAERRNLEPSDPYYAYRIHAYNDLVKRLAGEEKVRLVDLESVFERIPQEELESYFHERDFIHPNARGSRLIAETVASEIAAEFKSISSSKSL